MPGDLDPADLPPGLRDGYREGTRDQLAVLAGLADRLTAVPGDTQALDQFRREVHKIHGSAGSFGFWEASRLAAGMEETAKDWQARAAEQDVDRGSLARWFVVRLAQTLEVEVPPTTRPDRPTGKQRALQVDRVDVPQVIVVEDDPALGDLLEYGLRSQGYRFAMHRNGREALEYLRGLDVGRQQPLLLLDVDLPGLDGYSIFAALHQERPGAFRVVFTTVHGDESEQLRGLEAGALDYLVKPMSLRVALEKIRRWVGR